MPKKTRKEKALSEQRRKLKLLEQLSQPLSTVASSIDKTDKASPKELKTDSSELEFTLSEAEMLSKKYFLKDLKKSLLLIGLVIALEIIVYFGTINNYFNF